MKEKYKLLRMAMLCMVLVLSASDVWGNDYTMRMNVYSNPTGVGKVYAKGPDDSSFFENSAECDDDGGDFEVKYDEDELPSNYFFLGWSENKMAKAASDIVSTDNPATISYSVSDKAMNVYANFTRMLVKSNNDDYGKAAMEDNLYVVKDDYEVTLKATPEDGCRFLGWLRNEETDYCATTENYTFTVGNATAGIYTAVFAEGMEVVVPPKQYVTFYSELFSLTVNDDAARLLTISGVNGTEVTAVDIGSANAGMPFLVYNSSDEAKTFSLVPTENEVNQTVYAGFKGTAKEKNFTAADMTLADYYVFKNGIFVNVMNAGKIAAHRCWLELPAASGARELSIVWADATGLDRIIGTMSETSDDVYDLSGRKVSTLKKGIYIKNGKKRVVK